LPQVIARISIADPIIRRLIHDLLANTARVHPQSLVWKLGVSLKSTTPQRVVAAKALAERMKQHSPKLVEQVRDKG
jgi:FKBP12-rapamycin complex-associated protein